MTSIGPATVSQLHEALMGRSDLRVVRHVIESSACAILVTDRDGRYVAVNDAACRLTGYTPRELLRKGLVELTGPVDAGVSDVLWRAFLDQGEQRGEYTLSRKDGTTVKVHYEAMANVAPGLHASFLFPV